MGIFRFETSNLGIDPVAQAGENHALDNRLDVLARVDECYRIHFVPWWFMLTFAHFDDVIAGTLRFRTVHHQGKVA